ncbi:glycosyltransferase [Flavobacteriales bacterium]|nr:glycosyltransferase [Flavobacteriales bacterium]
MDEAQYPLISLILPVYNGERFLKVTLESIAAQGYPNLELIIIDDGSTDRSLEIINAFPLPKTVITQENTGVYTARNLGLSVAKGEIISLFDADDIMPKENLMTLCNYLLANPDVLIVRGMLQRFSDKDASNRIFKSPSFERFCLGTALIRKEAFRIVGTFVQEMRLGADADWYLRTVELDINTVELEHTSVLYRMHQDNISNQTDEAKKFRIEIIRRKLQRGKQLSEAKPEPRTVSAKKPNTLLKKALELNYWTKKKASEEDLSNKHYEFFHTTHFNIPVSFYADKTILDIGCGPRGSLEWANGAKRRMGLDPLANEYKKLIDQNQGMEYICASAEDIPLQTGECDAVFLFNSLNHTENIEQTLQEVIRITKLGGILLLLVEVNHEPTVCEPHKISQTQLLDLLGKAFECESLGLYQTHPDGIYQAVRQNIELPDPKNNGAIGYFSAKLIRIENR